MVDGSGRYESGWELQGSEGGENLRNIMMRSIHSCDGFGGLDRRPKREDPLERQEARWGFAIEQLNKRINS